RGRLAGAPPLLDLPSDRPRPARRTGRGARRSILFDAPLVAELRTFAGRLGTTPFVVLLAAFETLLGRACGVEDLVVGTPFANRTLSESEPLVGCFVNSLALRGDLSGDPAFADLVARTHEVVLDAQGHQDLPFERLVEDLAPARDGRSAPVFQVLLSLQTVPAAPTFAGLAVELVDVEIAAVQLDL